MCCEGRWGECTVCGVDLMPARAQTRRANGLRAQARLTPCILAASSLPLTESHTCSRTPWPFRTVLSRNWKHLDPAGLEKQ